MANKPRRATQTPPKNRKARRARKAQFDDTPDGVAARIEAEILAEEGERAEKRRASGNWWAPIVEPVFAMGILAAIFVICAWYKLPQGIIGMSAVAALINFVAAYGINRARVVGKRFPARVSGVVTAIVVGLACASAGAYAAYERFA